MWAFLLMASFITTINRTVLAAIFIAAASYAETDTLRQSVAHQSPLLVLLNYEVHSTIEDI